MGKGRASGAHSLQMRILILADKPAKELWDNFTPGRLDGIDLILSCGDLPPQYLSFLTCFTHAPILYVHGNHDDCYDETPPEGCVCIDDALYVHNGIRILGLGGSIRYKRGTYQFTQKQMNRRIRKLRPRLFFKKGFDILLTHAPAKGLNDGTDRAHEGFAGFLELLDRYRPKYFIHGHVHISYGLRHKRLAAYGDTVIVNGYEKYILETDAFDRPDAAAVRKKANKKRGPAI